MVHGRTKQHPEELRAAAIRQFRSRQNVAQLAREIGIPRQTLYRWIDERERVEADEDGRLVPAAKDRQSRLRKRIALLKHALADLDRSYLRVLRKHGIAPSVSRSGTPGDNAHCESFFWTLKREEIQAKEYSDLDDLSTNIARFIDQYYNERRLHSALGYRTPAEFERLSSCYCETHCG